MSELPIRVVMACPKCEKDGTRTALGFTPTVSTDAASVSEIPNGHRWLGARCDMCGASFTIEALVDPPVQP